MRKILRTQQLSIDLPTPGAEPWLNVIVQYVEMDDTLTTAINVVDRWGQVNATVASMAMNPYPFSDPIPVPAGHISGYAIVTSFTAAIISLIIAKYGGTFDPATGYIIIG